MPQHRLFAPLALAAFALAPLGLAAPAQAQSVTADDGGPVIAWYLTEGATVEKTIDDYGDPLLSVTHLGRAFSIYFYGCTAGRDCDAIQFYSGYRTDGAVRQTEINDWNTNRRYLRAYLSETGSARVEYDVFLGADGISAGDFAEITGIWLRGMDDFETHIDW